MNGADKANAALKAVDVVIAGRAVAMGVEIRRYAICSVMASQLLHHLRVGDRLHLLAVPDGHELDKTDVHRVSLG